jgi:arabinogalactan endo-1,4-beta-galactosidase
MSSIMINSHTSEGAKFFNQNRNDLMQTLTNSGVQISELKLDSGNNLNSGNDKNDQSVFSQLC